MKHPVLVSVILYGLSIPAIAQVFPVPGTHSNATVGPVVNQDIINDKPACQGGVFSGVGSATEVNTQTGERRTYILVSGCQIKAIHDLLGRRSDAKEEAELLQDIASAGEMLDRILVNYPYWSEKIAWLMADRQILLDSLETGSNTPDITFHNGNVDNLIRDMTLYIDLSQQTIDNLAAAHDKYEAGNETPAYEVANAVAAVIFEMENTRQLLLDDLRGLPDLKLVLE